MLTQIMHVNFSSMTAPHLISVVQGDTGRNLKCIVDDFTLDGAWTATWYVERPSDVPVYNTGTIETSDNSVNIELTAQSINEVGDNKLQVRILDADDQVVTSFACILSVKPFGGIDAVESTTESNIFDQQVAEAKQEIDTALDEHLENGIFPTMTAGGLVGDSYAENKVPYFFRQSGGGAEVGTIEAPVLVGGSVGWNQLVPNTGSSLSVTVTSGHKYVMKKSGTLSVGLSDGSALTGLTGGSDMVTDLTLLLGTTIADRLYTLEQSTAGSGIAQLRAWGFDFDEYIPYSAPTLKHVEGVSAHKFVGFNQWDEEWEVGGINVNTGENVSLSDRIRGKNYIPALPNKMYFFGIPSTTSGNVYFYDADKNFISQVFKYNETFTTPANCCFMRIGIQPTYGTTYHNDICINLSNSAKNGQYEPYRTWSYALDSTLTLRGVPKLDANNQLYFDGDTYEPDGTVTRRYGIVDLGTLNWVYDRTTYTYPFYYADLNGCVSNNIICERYVTAENSTAFANNDKVVRFVTTNYKLRVKDFSYTDATTFKTAMSGIYLVYEVATETTETATPFAEYQEVDANGTEEYVSTGVVPVGHTTKYPTDLKGAFESILSAIPSANGTYALKVTVANGKHTFSWV